MNGLLDGLLNGLGYCVNGGQNVTNCVAQSCSKVLDGLEVIEFQNMLGSISAVAVVEVGRKF